MVLQLHTLEEIEANYDGDGQNGLMGGSASGLMGGSASGLMGG